MYLRPGEVARVLGKVSFTVDVVTQGAYGYRRGGNYVYANREARMGRTALVIHPALKEHSSTLTESASDTKTCDHYEQFPLCLVGERHEHYDIPHDFSSRVTLERYLNGLFGEASWRRDWRRQLRKEESGFYLPVTAGFKQSAAIIEEVTVDRPHQHRNNDV